jgi:hypothetical protein
MAPGRSVIPFVCVVMAIGCEDEVSAPADDTWQLFGDTLSAGHRFATGAFELEQGEALTSR